MKAKQATLSKQQHLHHYHTPRNSKTPSSQGYTPPGRHWPFETILLYAVVSRHRIAADMQDPPRNRNSGTKLGAEPDLLSWAAVAPSCMQAFMNVFRREISNFKFETKLAHRGPRLASRLARHTPPLWIHHPAPKVEIRPATEPTRYGQNSIWDVGCSGRVPARRPH